MGDARIPVWLSELSCTGEEKSLLDCEGSVWHSAADRPCEHVEDVAIECSEACGAEEILDNGVSYRGCQSQTISGFPCIKWTDDKAQELTNASESVWQEAGLGNHNLCRNPSVGINPNAETIWCVVDHELVPGSESVEWDWCDPLAEKTKKRRAEKLASQRSPPSAAHEISLPPELTEKQMPILEEQIRDSATMPNTVQKQEAASSADAFELWVQIRHGLNAGPLKGAVVTSKTTG